MVDHSIHIGKTFGRLTILGFVRTRDEVRYDCLCECGNLARVRKWKILGGKTHSCGCYAADILKKRTHGLRHTKAYRAWTSMRTRCTNPNYPFYPHYGERGIKVCERWESFLTFLEDMGEPPSPKHSLDRIDNDGNYEPGNCRWATDKEQNRNTSRSRFIDTPDGIMVISQAAEFYGISQDTLKNRANAGDTGDRLVRSVFRPQLNPTPTTEKQP